MATAATTEEMDFIRAICANPDDDAPRLIFADWLDEHGKDSHTIRFQMVRTPDPLSYRACAYWRQIHKGDDIPNWINGFIERLECSAEHWFYRAPKWREIHPIRHIKLTTMFEGIEMKPTAKRFWEVKFRFRYSTQTLTLIKRKVPPPRSAQEDWPDYFGRVCSRIWPSISFEVPQTVGAS